MGDYLMLVPLVAALGIGWLLGRVERKKSRQEKLQQHFSKAYFNGLSQLINNDADKAVDSFIEALRLDSETVPLRLALGTLFRQRGEIQRATQIHQEILAYPQLTADESVQVQLALAEDYLAAGWFDRAENLLLGIAEHKGRQRRQRALRLLITLYEQEKEWQKALDWAPELDRGEQDLGPSLAHYCCELAQVAIKAADDKAVRGYLKLALDYDSACVRASLLLAEWEMAQERWKHAIKILRRIEQQAPAFVSEAIPLLVHCHRQLNLEDELYVLLESSMAAAPSTTTLLALADLIAQRRGDYQAASYITDQLKRRPTVRGFNRLIDFHLLHAEGDAHESLAVLRGLSGQLMQVKPNYQCGQCGFSGKRLHWLCPGCRSWGTVAPIQGLEGE
ncbi:lipopolysaccharide assembly protein LapB [Motiliproteus sediminis]|uniref:lipopolysaccharide assembly protein LapB n=1 Tax=Motiliproteus sediminis TaxID=1468178 RepID=UPI001AEF6582|nr:lipopolysaccharide assembly protein LapB [Motiliproteus sediminis]